MLLDVSLHPGPVGRDWSSLSHMQPLWQGAWDTRSDSPARPPEWGRGGPTGEGRWQRRQHFPSWQVNGRVFVMQETSLPASPLSMPDK